MKAKKVAIMLIGMTGTMAATHLANAAGMIENGVDTPLMIAATQTYEGEGTVKNIDMESKEITISHGPIKSIGWHAMTMSFDVEDADLLNEIKSGDKIYFEFYQGSDNRIIVTDIEVQ